MIHISLLKKKKKKGEHKRGKSYLHQCSHQGRKAKALNNDSTEVGNTTIGNVADDTKNKEHVQLVVFESLKDLVRLEVLVLDTSLVLSDAINRNPALSLAETGSFDG